MGIYHSKGRHNLKAPSQCNRAHNRSYVASFGLPKRYTRLIFVFLILFVIWLSGRKYLHKQKGAIKYEMKIAYPQVQEVADRVEHELPPLFESYRQYEDEISQSNIDIENSTGRYIFFAN